MNDIDALLRLVFNIFIAIPFRFPTRPASTVKTLKRLIDFSQCYNQFWSHIGLVRFVGNIQLLLQIAANAPNTQIYNLKPKYATDMTDPVTHISGQCIGQGYYSFGKICEKSVDQKVGIALEAGRWALSDIKDVASNLYSKGRFF
ncbi:hypothetical protein [Gilvimarinus sp. DA14]|uniref:hypothetical protein n=1 Tax=Gilvimarinus sp. DA14 TaxID=2956798 RepID=UPI0020B6A004|nr:hypothetical protein [Gilvimarinus sp. DA14]UTF59024.1 hypothetical protein NHM04_11100 [Gilvimarinus sp. DA14]